ncbi:MAG: hypothetical protein EBY61_06740, partial [Actinobacteria bacterium]|nr:hypothetical protein [Actinomycetota bacterium]
MSFTIATTVDEVLVALGAGARPIAGGTDLVVGARHGKAALPADLHRPPVFEADIGTAAPVLCRRKVQSDQQFGGISRRAT